MCSTLREKIPLYVHGKIEYTLFLHKEAHFPQEKAEYGLLLETNLDLMGRGKLLTTKSGLTRLVGLWDRFDIPQFCSGKVKPALPDRGDGSNIAFRCSGQGSYTTGKEEWEMLRIRPPGEILFARPVPKASSIYISPHGLIFLHYELEDTSGRWYPSRRVRIYTPDFLECCSSEGRPLIFDRGGLDRVLRMPLGEEEFPTEVLRAQIPHGTMRLATVLPGDHTKIDETDYFCPFFTKEEF